MKRTKTGAKSGDRKVRPPATVDEYLAGVPKGFRSALKDLRRTIRSAAPGSTEVISYGIPIVRYKRPLVAYAAFRDHCSLIVMSRRVMRKFETRLKGYSTTGVTIHFTDERPLPVALVKRIITMRVAEVDRAWNA